MRATLAGILIVILFLVSGCGNMANVEQTAVSSGLGVDLDSKGDIWFFAQFNRPINVQNIGTNDAQSDVFSGKGQTPSQAARDITLVMPRLPLWSHADIFILGENLARTDLYYIADFLARNRNIRSNAIMILAHNATPYDIFNGECPLALCSARGIMNILSTQEEQYGIYVTVTAVEFLSKLLAPGIDPVIPQVTTMKKEGKQIITLDGMAVFRQNRLVGSLNELESRGYRWLNPTRNKGGLMVLDDPAPGLDFITLEVSNFNSRTRPRLEGDKVIMEIEVNALVNIYDLGGVVDVQRTEKEVPLENLAAEEIERQIRACISKAQLLDADILGWGQTLHHYQLEEWKPLEPIWYEIFPEVTAQIVVKVDLGGQGQLLRPLPVRR